MQIYDGKLINDGMGKNSTGGTEVMAGRISKLDKKLLKECQIVVSRIEQDLDPTKIRIYYAHDLPGDPAANHLAESGYDKFHKIVFVSNWQMQSYITAYQIPWSKCIVMQNAVDPIPASDEKWFPENVEKIRLIYTPTPHRGLEILVPVFQKLCENFDNLELEVFSSFDLYGWGDRDEQFRPLIDQCKNDPKIIYHGTKTNELVVSALKKSHIFAYPAIWPETSCLSLMEAMSAGCVCVHSDYGALYETAANWTHMYHYNEDRNEHAKLFYTVLASAIEDIKAGPATFGQKLKTQKSYADIFYSWDPSRRIQWNALLAMLIDSVHDRGFAGQQFVYKT